MSWWLGAAPSQAAGTATNVAVTLSSPTLVADGGTSSITATARVTDLAMLPVTGDTVVFTSSDGGETISPTPATDNGDGTYTARIFSSATPGPVTITATDSTSGGITGVAPLTQTPVPPPPPPTNISPPTISPPGPKQQGQVLTGAPGSWTNSPTSFSYQWDDCTAATCNPSATSTNSTSYTLTAADIGFRIRLVVTATNANPIPGQAPSAATAVVTLPPPVNTAPPIISGSPAPGQTLTEAQGAWTNSPTSYAYQWLACDSAGNNCAPISSLRGGTNQSYAVNVLDLGHTIRVQEIASNAGGPGVGAISAPTGLVLLNSSSTSLSTSPSASVTDQSVTLTAAITSSISASGFVTFEHGGVAISGGCTNVPVSSSTQSVNVSCKASFAASSSPEALTAVFTAAPGSGVAGSASVAVSLAVSKDSTSTALDVSNPAVRLGSSTTYTATVSPVHAGPVQASGVVEFFDGRKAIAGCGRQPLATSGGHASATCAVRYGNLGKHRIVAVYGADANFTGSKSPLLPVRVRKLHARAIASTMQWTFFFTPAYTRVLTLVVNGPPLGGTVLVKCRGQGCPFTTHSTIVTKAKPCHASAKHRCSASKPLTINLMRGFRKHHLRVGAQIIVDLIRPNFIGKNYVFKVRSGGPPVIQIRCLVPGASRPGIGC